MIGAVVIGRNEGARLDAGLSSLAGRVAVVVYVDSGSSDNSLEIARAQNAEIVELDMATPFTAARARNAGFKRLSDLHDDLDYVQFVDGDCMVDDGWVACAEAFLEEHPEVAVVSGRLRERYPEFSVYNRLCDIEWDTPVGETAACGGIAMMRARAFREVGGFDPAVIAGEEPELCLRLRAEGWKIWRLDAEMAFHDAAMTSFAQWWRRSQRTGYGYALGASLHSGASERLWRRQQLRAVFWGAVLPVITLGGSFLHPAALMLLFLYPLQLVRTAFRCRKLGAFSLVYASSMTIGKFAEMLGIIRFNLDRLRGRRSTIIEYKTGAPDDGDRGAFL